MVLGFKKTKNPLLNTAGFLFEDYAFNFAIFVAMFTYDVIKSIKPSVKIKQYFLKYQTLP